VTAAKDLQGSKAGEEIKDVGDVTILININADRIL